MPANPIINGFVPEWAELQIQVKNIIYLGIVALDYDTDSDGVDVKGTFPEAIARTLGTKTHRASFEMLLPDAAAFLAALGDDYRRIPFDVTCNYSAGGEGDVVCTDVLASCLIKTVTNSHRQGSDALTRKFDIRPFRIKRSTSTGLFLVDVNTEIVDPFI